MFIIAAIAMAIYALTDTGFAFLMRNLIQYLEPEGLSDEEMMMRRFLPAAIIGLFLTRGLVAFLSAYCLGWIGRNVIRVLRGRAFEKFLVLPTSFFDSISAGEMLSRLTFNVELVAEATSNVVTVAIRDTLTIIFLLSYMIYLSLPLTGILMVTGPLMGLVISFSASCSGGIAPGFRVLSGMWPGLPKKRCRVTGSSKCLPGKNMKANDLPR